MKDKHIDFLFKTVYTVSAALVLIGAFFRLQHYPYGYNLLFTGFFIGSFISYLDNYRLRQKIKELEKAK